MAIQGQKVKDSLCSVELCGCVLCREMRGRILEGESRAAWHSLNSACGHPPCCAFTMSKAAFFCPGCSWIIKRSLGCCFAVRPYSFCGDEDGGRLVQVSHSLLMPGPESFCPRSSLQAAAWGCWDSGTPIGGHAIPSGRKPHGQGYPLPILTAHRIGCWPQEGVPPTPPSTALTLMDLSRA